MQVCRVVAFLVKWEKPTGAYTKNEYTVRREAVGQRCMSAAIRTDVGESSSWQMCAVSWALCGFVLQVECRQISFNRWQNNVHCMLGGKGHISLCFQRMSVTFNQLRQENELTLQWEKLDVPNGDLVCFLSKDLGKRKELLVNSKSCSIFRKFRVRYSRAKKYLVSHQLCKFSHLKRWERPVIFIIGLPQLWETKWGEKIQKITL